MARPDEFRLLQAIQEIQGKYIEDAPRKELADAILAQLLALSQSASGLVGEVRTADDGAPHLETWAVSDSAWDEMSRRMCDENQGGGLESRNLDGLLGSVMTSAEPVIANDPSNDPRRTELAEGYLSLDSFLGLPLHHKGRIVGLVGVANRAGGYDQGDVEFLAPFLGACAAVLHAWRNARERERLQGEQDPAQLLADVSSDGGYIIAVTPDGSKMEWVDKAFCRLTGWGLEEIDDLRWEDLLAEDEKQRAISTAMRLAIGETDRADLRIIRRDGEMRWVHRSQRKYEIPGAPGSYRLVGSFHDVTDRVEADLERRRVEDELRHVQKIDAIGTLAGGVAHDFNNVLYVILGNTELSLKKISEDHPARKNLREILSAARRGADVTNRILAYSRVGSALQQASELGAVVAETRDFLAATLPSSTEIVFRGDPSGWFVPVGAADLQQVLVNLCTNASHAMSSAGQVRIHFDRNRDEGGAGSVRIVVEDDGNGMPPALLQHVFEPYFTTKPRGKGTGLGLAVAQGTVKGAGGTIEIDSEVGRGTSVTITLPLIARPADRIDTDPMLPQGRESVLFVDDEPRVVRLGQELLESLGYTVEALTSSRVALEQFGADPQRFDIVVTDQTMPQLTGDAFAREIQRIRPGTPVVLCTGLSERLDPGEWHELGVYFFLQKPFGLEQLGTTVRRALDESRGA